MAPKPQPAQKVAGVRQKAKRKRSPPPDGGDKSPSPPTKKRRGRPLGKATGKGKASEKDNPEGEDKGRGDDAKEGEDKSQDPPKKPRGRPLGSKGKGKGKAAEKDDPKGDDKTGDDAAQEAEMVQKPKGKSRTKTQESYFKDLKKGLSISMIEVMEGKLFELDQYVMELLPGETENDQRFAHSWAYTRLEPYMHERTEPWVPPTTNEPTPAEVFMARPPLPDGKTVRKITHFQHGRKITIGNGGYVLAIIDQNKTPNPTNRSFIFKKWIPVEGISQTDAAKIADAFCRLVERWPTMEPADMGGKGGEGNAMLRIAMQYACPEGRQLPYNSIDVKGVKTPNPVYSTRCEYLTPIGTKTVLVSVNPDTVNMHLPPPDIPSNVSFGRQKGSMNKDPVPDTVKASDKMKHQRAVEILKHLAVSTHGRQFESTHAFDAFVGMERDLFCSKQTHQRGGYKGHPFIKRFFDRAAGKTRVEFSKAVMDDLEVDFAVGKSTTDVSKAPRMFIKSLVSARFTPVSDAAWAALRAGLGVKHIIKTTCRAVDLVNIDIADGIPPKLTCNCNDEQRQTELHACLVCGQPAKCATQFHSDFFQHRACATCTTKADQYTKGSYFVENMLQKLRRLVKAEHVASNKSFDCDARVNEIADEFGGADKLKSLPFVIEDALVPGVERKKERRTTKSTRSYYRDAFSPSFDGIEPSKRQLDGTIGSHVLGNLWIIGLWLNLAKHTWLVGIFAVVQMFCSLDLSDEETSQALDQADEISVIGVKTPYRKKAKFGEEMSVEQDEIRKQEWRTCKLAPSREGAEKPWEAESRSWYGTSWRHARPKGWEISDRTIAVSNDVVQYWRGVRGSALQVAERDGCWYPAHPRSMPKDWNWWDCWAFFSIHLLEMWRLCNGRWLLVDTVETLYLECLWQWCSGERGLFGLPWVFWARHPFRLAICHALHGVQMRTAWTTRTPTSITDRDPSLLTIIIQTAFENYGECNFDDVKEKDQMRDEIKRVVVPKQYYDPGAARDLGEEDPEAFSATRDDGELFLGGMGALEEDMAFLQGGDDGEEGEEGPPGKDGEEGEGLSAIARAEAALPTPFTGDIGTLSETEIIRRNALYYDRLRESPKVLVDPFHLDFEREDASGRFEFLSPQDASAWDLNYAEEHGGSAADAFFAMQDDRHLRHAVQANVDMGIIWIPADHPINATHRLDPTASMDQQDRTLLQWPAGAP